MPTPFVLAIDQGTTSTRAVVYDGAGVARGSAARELTQHYPQPGWVEHDAEEIWDGVRDVVPRALAQAGVEARAQADEPWVHQRTGLVIDPYFSATKLGWLLGQDAGWKARAEAGRLAAGTVDS